MPSRSADLSADDARRVHLAAQGFGGPRTGGSLADVRKLARRLNAFQIDSVNVLVRAHHMPAFSRLGPYDIGALDTLAYDKRELFEYWGHAACYLTMSLYPLFRWRMEQQASVDFWKKLDAKRRRFAEAVYDEVASKGPIGGGALSMGGKGTGNWWGWSDAKMAIETLFRIGRVSVSGRKNFQRLYDITERVIPQAVLEAPVPDKDEAKKQLLLVAAKALGIGTEGDIAGYYYIDGWWDRAHVNGKKTKSEVPRLVGELVDEGRLVPATVEGWSVRSYVLPRTKVPHQIHARALVSPFDPVMWERIPTSRLFGFNYKIEIYVPEPKRIYGYYCLPFLLGDRFVARVDLKADRKNKTLLVPGAFLEKGAEPKRVASELADELRLMASWLGLERIEVGERGDVVRPLARELSRTARR